MWDLVTLAKLNEKRVEYLVVKKKEKDAIRNMCKEVLNNTKGR